MEKDLRSKLVDKLSAMSKRITQLENNALEYKKFGDFEHAMACDMKCRQLKLVLESFNELL